MRIVHTSDWHAGRNWKNQNRLPELQAVLDNLARFIERERIDLVLMSGDVFDTLSPSADAERVVTGFFKRLGAANVPSVLIAGNHDSPQRIEAWGMLAEFVGVQARGLPRRRTDGGLVEVATKSGQTALVAALPFAPVGRIVEALTLAHDETLARQKYADTMQRMWAHLAEGFRPNAVNLVVAHSHIQGAKPTGSERVITLGDDWAATATALPNTAQYVALGHIHCPQRVDAAGPHTEYAGSPMQLDFGEVDQVKTFVVIDVVPGRPPKVEHVPYEGAKTLGQWEGPFAEFEQQLGALATFGFVRLTLHLDAPMSELNRKVREKLPNVVSVDAILPTTEQSEVDQPSPNPEPRDRFRAFYKRQHQREPRPETLTLFDELYHEAEGH